MLDHIGQFRNLNRSVIKQGLAACHYESIVRSKVVILVCVVEVCTLSQSFQFLSCSCDAPTNLRRPPSEFRPCASPTSPRISIREAICRLLLRVCEQRLPLCTDFAGVVPLLRLRKHGTKLCRAVLNGMGDHSKLATRIV